MRLVELLTAAVFLAVLVGGCQQPESLAGPSGTSSDPNSYPTSALLVSADWLSTRLNDPSLRVIDLSPISDYQQGHIPGAVHLWWQDTIELHNDVYGMMVGESGVEQMVTEAGITPASHVVLYDSSGDRFAARMLWVLNANGFANTSLLNGGRQAWVASRFPLTKAIPAVPAGHLDLTLNYDVLVGAETVAAHLNDRSFAFVDSRTASEQQQTWYGKLRVGRIPNAVMVPWDQMTFGEPVPYYRGAETLRALFEQAGVTPDKTVVVYGLDGVTAAQTYVALKLLGYPSVLLYDGSWAQWGSSVNLPIAPLPLNSGAATPAPVATP